MSVINSKPTAFPAMGWKLASLWALLVLVICFSACVPKSSGPKTRDNPVQDKDSVLSLTKTDKQDKTVPEAENKDKDNPDEDWPGFTGPVDMQKILSRSYILPESFLIGPLSDSLSSFPEERNTVHVVREFWKRFQSGKSLSSLLATYPHPLFLEELEQYSGIAAEIRAVETGRPNIEGNSGRMLCLVFSDSGCLEGTLYLIREEGDWFLEDWEIPFRDWPGKEAGREEERISPPANW